MSGDSAQAPSAMARIFVALRPPPAVRAALWRYQQSCLWPSAAARVPPEKLHVTLHFLGNVPRARVPELLPALRVACTPFCLTLRKTSLWPGGIATLSGVVPPDLETLRSRLSLRLEAMGLAVDAREYKLHLTLARNAQGMRWPQAAPDFSWCATRYVLFESAHPGALPYKMLGSYPMRGNAATDVLNAHLENPA